MVWRCAISSSTLCALQPGFILIRWVMCTLAERIVNIIRYCGAIGEGCAVEGVAGSELRVDNARSVEGSLFPGGHLRIIDRRAILEASGHHSTFVTIAAHCTPFRLHT